MSEFMTASEKVNQAVIAATSGVEPGYEKMRAALRSALQADGVIVRDRESELGIQMVPGKQAEPTPQVALPAPTAPATHMRVVYPRGNDRMEIYGASEAELDAKEQQIRAIV